MTNILDDIRGIGSIYKSSIYEATSALIKAWPILPASLFAYAAFAFLLTLVGGLGMAGGFIAGLAYIALLSFFYNWMSAAVQRQKITFRSLGDFDWSLFSSLMSVGFILWIAHMLIEPFSMTEETHWIFACIELAIFILLNAIPEIVYIKRFESIVALKYSFSFVKDNWIEWFAPLVILLLPILLARPISVLTSLAGVNPFSAGGDPLFPARFIFSQSASFLTLLLGSIGIALAIVVTVWFMLFRGFLFQKLDGSSRRQRTYKSKYS